MNQRLTDPLTERIIGVAIEVHRELGPGFLESIYEEAMAAAGLRFARQPSVPIVFRGHSIGIHRLDFLVEAAVVLELKAIKSFEDIHIAVVRSYIRASHASCGLLLNFAAPTLQVRRIGAEYRPRA